MSALTALTLEEGMAHLAAIVGPAHMHLQGETIAVAPADTQQLSAVLRLADANGLSVAATGKGTKLAWGNPLVPDIRLGLERMNRLREHSWQDMTCTVEAGCPWAAMQDDLKRHGQMVALDPLWPGQATIGGIVAVNDSGALRLRYGGLRDLILGMTVVLADGTIAKSGGKVVKNVAGYDLHKLMTGSFGTLGVIAEVNFRLHPVEEHARTWTAVAPDAAQLAEPLRALHDAQLSPSSVQIRVLEQDCAADIRIASRPECLDLHAARLREIFAPLDVVESAPAVWQARQDLFAANPSILLKVSLLPSEICAVCSELRQWSFAERAEVAAVAQATGLMTVAFLSQPFAALLVVERLRARLGGSHSSMVALQIHEDIRDRFDVWDASPGALPLMREIKRRFDPNRILNPGRFVGNI
jgi:glycolate oxidase FAD binding subunit